MGDKFERCCGCNGRGGAETDTCIQNAGGAMDLYVRFSELMILDGCNILICYELNDRILSGNLFKQPRIGTLSSKLSGNLFKQFCMDVGKVFSDIMLLENQVPLRALQILLEVGGEKGMTLSNQ